MGLVKSKHLHGNSYQPKLVEDFADLGNKNKELSTRVSSLETTVAEMQIKNQVTKEDAPSRKKIGNSETVASENMEIIPAEGPEVTTELSKVEVGAPLDSLLPEFQLGGYTYRGASLLHRLTAKGDLETLEQRRAEVGAAVDGVCQLQNSEGHVFTQVTALTMAAKLQLCPVALLLLDEGADPNIPCRGKTAAGRVWEVSPLYWAAKVGLEELCCHLLDKGASCSLGDYSPVQSAASGRVRKILREGEDRWRQDQSYTGEDRWRRDQSYTSLNPYCIDTKFNGGD